MLNLETQAHIRHLFYAEHWKIGTMQNNLVSTTTLCAITLQTDSFHRELALRPCITDPYLALSDLNGGEVSPIVTIEIGDGKL